MKALVLGGSRFVGLRLVRRLVGEGHQVATLNRGTREQRYPVEQIRADRKHPGQVREALRSHHFDAAFDISAYTPDETRPVVETLEGHVDRFVHISTAAVYGGREELPRREDAHLQASDPWGQYAKDKIACEELLLQAHERAGFPAVILRPPYIYGPHNHLYREAYFYDRAEAGRPIPIPEGNVKVHFCHVDDLATAFLKAATMSGIEGRAFNVAAREPVTFHELAECGAAPVGADADVVTLPESRVSPLFPFGNFAIHLDVSRASSELRFKPRTMEEGLADTYQWYRSHHPFGPPDFSKDESVLRGDG